MKVEIVSGSQEEKHLGQRYKVQCRVVPIHFQPNGEGTKGNWEVIQSEVWRPRVIANLKREMSGRQSSFLNRSSTLSGKGYGGV